MERKKITLLVNEDTDALAESVAAFAEYGWQSFVIGSDDLEKVVEVLRNEG